MPRSAGTYSLPAGQPVVVGTTISDTVFNTLTSDIANELTNSIPRDGTAPPTANLPMGNFKITGLANGTLATDAVAFGQLPTSYPATSIVNTPAGNIAATNVQSAINELDTEKANIGANNDITALNALASVPTVVTNAINAVPVPAQIQSVTCTQSGGALTFGFAAGNLDFRSTTLTTGVKSNVTNAALSLTLASGGTLGFVTTVQGRAILVAINNAGTAELAVISLAGGNDLSETGVINTTAIGAGSTAANVFYSTTARTGVAYRVVGAIDAVNTAGSWATPVLVQGMGGQALTSMSSYGFGQTMQNVIGSRALNTIYYNTTGKPIDVFVVGTSTVAANFSSSVNGLIKAAFGQGIAGVSAGITFSVPVGGNYQVTVSAGTPTITTWNEQR